MSEHVKQQISNSPARKDGPVSDLFSPVSQTGLRIQRYGDGDPEEYLITQGPVAFYRSVPSKKDARSDAYDFQLTDGTAVTLVRKYGDWDQVTVVKDGTSYSGFIREGHLAFTHSPLEGKDGVSGQVVDLPAVTVTALSNESVISKADAIAEHLTYSINPFSPNLRIRAGDVNAALNLFEKYYEEYSEQDFLRIALEVKRRGLMERMFRNMEHENLLGHMSMIMKLSAIMPPSILFDVAEWNLLGQAVELSDYKEAYDMYKGGAKDIALKNWKAICLKMHKDMLEALDLKVTELRYYLETKRYHEIQRVVTEFANGATAAFELLFSDDPSHPYLSGPGYMLLKKMWKKLGSGSVDASVYLDGVMGKHLKNEYDPKTERLNQKTENKKSTDDTPNTGKDEDVSEKINTKKGEICEPGNSEHNTKAIDPASFIKEMIVSQAETFHNFFYGDVLALSDEYPILVPFVNAVLDQQIRPLAYKRLTKGSGFNSATGKKGAKKEPDLSKLKWIDLARIWYFELGDRNYGTKGNPMMFDSDDWTTRSISNHPSVQIISEYARARYNSAKDNGREPDGFYVLVHYDVSTFWKSIAQNDTALNFLGSFKVTVDYVNDEIKLSADNTSGWDSATRFRRTASTSGFNKAGVFEDTMRDQITNEDGSERLRLGGNLVCKWHWSEPLQKPESLNWKQKLKRTGKKALEYGNDAYEKAKPYAPDLDMPPVLDLRELLQKAERRFGR